MDEWRARMPRTPPDAGKAHVVFAIKRRDGGRMEYSGQVDEAKAVELLLCMSPEEIEQLRAERNKYKYIMEMVIRYCEDRPRYCSDLLDQIEFRLADGAFKS